MPAVSAWRRSFPSATLPSSLVDETVRRRQIVALAGTAIESVARPTVAALVERRRPQSDVRQGPPGVDPTCRRHGGSGDRACDGRDGRRQARACKPAFESRVKPREWARATTPLRVNQKIMGVQIDVRGKVLDADGKPVAGAQILLGLPVTGTGRLVTTPAPGCHRCGRSLCRSRSPANVGRFGPRRHGCRPVLAAFVPGLGPDWIALDPPTARSALTLRLRRDDVAIDGRILGLEGKPLASLTIRAISIANFPAALLNKLRENAGKMNPGLWGEMRDALILGNDGPISPVRTGIDGRFHLTGVGRDRAVVLLIEGESLEQSIAMVYTSSDRGYTPPLLPADSSGESRLFGPRFELTVAPGRLLEGVVREQNRAGRSSARLSARGRLA